MDALQPAKLTNILGPRAPTLLQSNWVTGFRFRPRECVIAVNRGLSS